MTTASVSAAHEPVQALIDRWWELGVAEAESQEQAISELEQTLQTLSGWGQQLAEQLEDRKTKQQRLEHDVASLRSRVTDLEKALQDRTEELLRAQAANNALAAELQQAEVEPFSAQASELDTAQIEQSPESPPLELPTEAMIASAPSTEAAPNTLAIDEAVSVSERFGKLRNRQSGQSAAS